MTGYAAQEEQIGQHIDHIHGLEPSLDADRNALVGELVDDVERAVVSPIVGSVLDKVIRQDMVRILRPQPDGGPVGKPRPGALGFFQGNFQPLAPSDPLDLLVVDDPARLVQQLGDFAIAVASILPGELDNVCG